MREIKFRAWVKKSWNNNEWIKNKMFYNVYPNVNSVNINDNELSFCYNKEGVLMQYTGLKDKNGVEIYEGDIVKYPNDECFGVVKYGKYSGGEYGTYTCGIGFYFKYRVNNISNMFNNEQLEVIGNIYQNPELLNN